MIDVTDSFKNWCWCGLSVAVVELNFLQCYIANLIVLDSSLRYHTHTFNCTFVSTTTHTLTFTLNRENIQHRQTANRIEEEGEVVEHHYYHHKPVNLLV